MKAMFVGGRLNGCTMEVDEIITKGLWNGKFSTDWSEYRNRGALVPRAELDNQPKVDGYLGPMWDGGVLRYETQDVYDMLSA